MPKDKVEAAIKRAAGRDATNYTETIYEAYAPHGVAVLVETTTDNPTRTVANVRSVFTKFGGNLASSGSVSFMFRKLGVFRLNPEGINQDDLELYLMDHGLDEMGEGTGEKGESQIVVRCAFDDFGQLQKASKNGASRPSRPSTNTCAMRPLRSPKIRQRSHDAAGQAGAGRGRPERLPHAGVIAQHPGSAAA